MSDENVGGLPDPAAILYPDSGFRRDDHAKALWRTHGYDTGGEPFYSADQLHSHASARVHAALSAHGQPVVWVNPDDLANPHFVSVNAAKEGHEDKGRHYTLPLYTHGQPVVDEAMVARAEAYTTRVLPGRSTACLGGQFNFCDLLTAALTGDKE